MDKESPLVTHARSVIGAANEIRLRLHDARVIFCSVISPVGEDRGSFIVRPWGVKTPTAIDYADVDHVASVTEMGWTRQQQISRAQLAGIFVE